jgi:RND family efflux transporter MFP subunit
MLMLGKRLRLAFLAFPLLVTALALFACGEENTYVAPPPPKVTVAKPLVEEVTEYLEFTGTTAAYASVDVPARVPGLLTRMHFEPGTPVNEGDLLFTIDPVEYEAQVMAAEAELAQAEARQSETAKALKRAETLAKKGNVSQAKLDEARADFLSAQAGVLVQKANLRIAQINLGYTEIRAPITGRVGRNLVDVGNLVGQGEATVLTDITTYDPIYVSFEVNERDLLRVMTMHRETTAGEGPAGKRSSATLELGLANEEGYPHKGKTDFAESQVDAETGTLRVRGVLDNPGAQPVLFPGLFARIRVPIAKHADMPLVSERALGFDQSGRFLLVVTPENLVEKRRVILGSLQNGFYAVEKGIDAEDRIVVKGLQRAREGAEVRAEEIDMATLAASALEKAVQEAGEVKTQSGDDPAAAQ